MKTLRCLIIDDEPLAIDVIENYLGRLKDIEISRCQSAVEAVQLMIQRSFDLIFLDIEMPLLTGFDFLKTIKDPPIVIITTAYRDYAVEGFEYEVADYLVKPVSFPRFMKAFERVLKLMDKNEDMPESGSGEFLFLKVDRKLLKILVSEILYIESLKDYIRVTTATESYISYQSLTSITEKLPQDKFMRIHRSFTVALEKIDSVDGNCVVIAGKSIPISRELKQDVLRILKS
jgi:DNA-binding LytR/AlgR family response regulator